MKSRLLYIVFILGILLLFSGQSYGCGGGYCPPCEPECPQCKICVCGSCVNRADGSACGTKWTCTICEGGSCVSSCESGERCCEGDPEEVCTGWCCYNESEGETCNNGHCCPKCEEYDAGTEECVPKCDPEECKECDPITGDCVVCDGDPDKICYDGICVECRDILDCELCEECIGYECVHPCDDCVWPTYCSSSGCSCVECYPDTTDTTTCSSSGSSDACTGCTSNPFSPCSGGEKIVYSNNPLTSCTGPDCGTQDVLCYTTYECEAEEWIPLYWCKFNVPGPDTCSFDIQYPVGPGCFPCVAGAGEPTPKPQGVCP